MKLPKPRKRGNTYRIELMLDGKRISATRDTAKECEQWASQKILEHKAQSKLSDKDKPTPTFAEIMTLYHQKIGKNKPSARTESTYQRCFVRDYPRIANTQIHHIQLIFFSPLPQHYPKSFAALNHSYAF